jgi:hypothetical protein
MPTEDDEKVENDDHFMNVSLVSEGRPLIAARIAIKCPTCGYKRVFRNSFTSDKIDLVLVTLKIIDWMTCESCSDMYDCDVEFTI